MSGFKIRWFRGVILLAVVLVLFSSLTILAAPIPSALLEVGGERNGSGFFITTDGYGITHRSVVGNSKELTLIAPNGVNVPAKVIRAGDAGLVLFKADVRQAPITVLGTSESLQNRLDVFLVDQGGANPGQITSLDIRVGNTSFFRVATKGIHASIGGAIFNGQGYLVGIVDRVLEGEALEAIPVEALLAFLEGSPAVAYSRSELIIPEASGSLLNWVLVIALVILILVVALVVMYFLRRRNKPTRKTRTVTTADDGFEVIFRKQNWEE